MTSPRVRPVVLRACVPLDGWSARLLVWHLEALGERDRQLQTARERGMPEPGIVELRFVLDQLDQLVAWWRDDVETQRVVMAGSEPGTASAEPARRTASSGQITSEQAADMIGRSTRWVVRLIHEGLLQAEMQAGRWWIDRDSVLAYLDQRPAA